MAKKQDNSADATLICPHCCANDGLAGVIDWGDPQVPRSVDMYACDSCSETYLGICRLLVSRGMAAALFVLTYKTDPLRVWALLHAMRPGDPRPGDDELLCCIHDDELARIEATQ